MTEIAGAGSLAAELARSTLQSQEQQQAAQQLQTDKDGQNAGDRRIEQAERGAGNPSDNPPRLDTSLDDVQQDQVLADVEEATEAEAVAAGQNAEREGLSAAAVEVNLSEAAQRAQQQAVQIANQDSASAEQALQTGVAQSNASLDSDDFTRIVDDKREVEDTANTEPRADRELGKVIDTFA